VERGPKDWETRGGGNQFKVCRNWGPGKVLKRLASQGTEAGSLQLKNLGTLGTTWGAKRGNSMTCGESNPWKH